MNLKDISIDGFYAEKGKKILDDFLLPCLKVSNKYNRITGYFTIESLLAISQGIESLYEKNGNMKLVIGIHSIPEELVESISMKEYLQNEIDAVRKEIQNDIKNLENELDKRRIATIAWMIEDGLLEVKAAAAKGTGIFHPKTLIFKDSQDNDVVAVGSSNETENGLGGNIEQLMIAKSWENKSTVDGLNKYFNQLWNNQIEDCYVEDITKNMGCMINDSLGDLAKRKELFNFEDNIISKMSNMPANFFVSGDIPSLYMHQERAVLDALSRWPVRVMLADEVGLGKTFEAAAVLAFMVKYMNIKKVVILTPKSVLQQWQDELDSHFGLKTWLYESSKREYKSSNGETINVGDKNPLNVCGLNIMLLSAQFARGTKGNGSIFLREDTELPDLLIVDEAHAARVSKDISGKRSKTQLYKMLEIVSKKIPHLILATATPMQKEAHEYHAMLKLLGLPKIWEKEENYDLSLRIVNSLENPDPSDCVNACSLLYLTLKKMAPNLEFLTDKEKALSLKIINEFKTMDGYERNELVKNNWTCFKSIFIKLHPAKLLTVRNTKKSLTNVGYKFPKRNLESFNIYNSDEIELFYEEVNRYLQNECFLVEKALQPDKKMNTGFLKASYQQRVASSLHSCIKSLSRRYLKTKTIYNFLKNDDISNLENSINSTYEIDDIDCDEILLSEDEVIEYDGRNDANKNELLRAVSLESAALGSLVDNAKKLLETVGDKKINDSLDLALEKVSNGDSVLIFSRYTDTIEALVNEFNSRTNKCSYAIYTGNESIVVDGEIKTQASKNQIKRLLFDKKIKIVFCSDAASEGLNLQAARVLINVDVPWTPARLEQRIGRVARLGQVAEEVDIYNVWYPHSIEARMYGRIQQRLRDANIAIGEFPEVLAADIRNSVINNVTDDSSLNELKEIRNSYQTKALEKLWINEKEKITSSEQIRNNLLEICKNNFDYSLVSESEEIFEFKVLDKNIELTSKTGKNETINLKSMPFKFFDIKVKDLICKENLDKKISYFSASDGNPIKFEKILDIAINNRKVEKTDYIKQWPNTLVNPKSLTLKYAIETDVEDPPEFWNNQLYGGGK